MNREKTNSPETSIQHREIDFRNLILTLYENKWLITAITAACVGLGAVYFVLKTPEYQSNALIQIESKDNNLGEFDSLPKLFDMKASPSDVQKALIDSRFVLDPVIEQLGLNISAEPHYFPVIGKYIAKHFSNSNSVKSGAEYSDFAWGNQQIKISYLELPHDYMNKKLKVIADNQGNYQLFDPNNKFILVGHVGQLATTPNGSSNPVAILINTLTSNVGTEYIVEKKFTSDVIRDLQKNFAINEVGSTDQANVKTGILNLSLTGPKPQQLVDTLNQIVTVSIQEDMKNKSAEAAKTLEFLNQQLPEIKDSLNQAEIALNDYRAKSGKLNLSVETELFLNQMADIEKQIGEAQLKKEELLQYYTAQHPFVQALESRQNQLRHELANLQSTLKKLPAEDQMALSLAREVRVKGELYLLLYKKMQELQVVAAGTVSDIRVLSLAKLPDAPLSQNIAVKLLALLFSGLALGTLTVLIRLAWHRKVHDPRWIEENLGIITVGMIPFSKKQGNLDRLLNKGLARESSLLAFNAPHDLAIEALRSLRTHLQFNLQTSRNNIIAITGISPGVGKSFICSNFAFLLADIGKKVLLIDGDIRRGHLYRYFNIKKTPGLSEVLNGNIELQQAVQQVKNSHLDILTAGHLISKSSELLIRNNFSELLQQVSAQYDVVIIDTAPILAVTDGVLVAKQAGINFLLIGSNMHHAEEIEFAVKRLYSNDIQIQGIIYNNISSEGSLYAYGKYRYRYYYEYEKA